MDADAQNAGLTHVEQQLAELERRYGIGGAERQAIIPEDVADKHRALVLRHRALLQQQADAAATTDH